jgi:hypothetical protein
MPRKLLGVFTAVAAALLLVGVAWASGDAASDDSSSSTAASAKSDISTSATVAASVTSTSEDDDQAPSTTVDDHDGTLEEDDETTGSTIDDDDTTGSTIDDDDTTSTSIDDHGTVDDDDEREEESRSVAPVDSEAKSYTVGAAGSVTAQIVAGRLVLLDVGVNTGWSFDVEVSDPDDIEVKFRNGEAEASFEAKLRDGEIRIEIEQESD